MGIDALVEARGYGETDSCGTYLPRGVDFPSSSQTNRFRPKKALMMPSLPRCKNMANLGWET